MIYRFNVRHNKKQTTVTAKDPKQAMRCVIHREHGTLPDVIHWNSCYVRMMNKETFPYELLGHFSIKGKYHTVSVDNTINNCEFKDGVEVKDEH